MSSSSVKIGFAQSRDYDNLKHSLFGKRGSFLNNLLLKLLRKTPDIFDSCLFNLFMNLPFILLIHCWFIVSYLLVNFIWSYLKFYNLTEHDKFSWISAIVCCYQEWEIKICFIETFVIGRTCVAAIFGWWAIPNLFKWISKETAGYQLSHYVFIMVLTLTENILL